MLSKTRNLFHSAEMFRKILRTLEEKDPVRELVRLDGGAG